MTDIPRISAEETWRKSSEGEAMLVCAYDDDEKFRMVHLDGATSLAEFRKKSDELDTEKNLIFYCA
jgi:rhodanese-related sulfurtransferase